MEKTNKVFVLGNGESRKGIDLDALRTKGPVYGCNALYRDWAPDALICVDHGMMHEVYDSGYALDNKCYFRAWSKLPAEAHQMLVNTNFFEGWDIQPHTENMKRGRQEFVMNGSDPNQIKRLYEHILKERPDADADDIRMKLGSHHQYVTWVAENDEVHIIPENYSGWSAGPIAVRLAIENHDPLDVFLIGFDLGSRTDTINNMYKGTDNYLVDGAKTVPATNWIVQHKQNFLAYPEVRFWKVNSAPLGTDDTCVLVDEWNDIENLQYTEQESLDLCIDFGFMM